VNPDLPAGEAVLFQNPECVRKNADAERVWQVAGRELDIDTLKKDLSLRRAQLLLIRGRCERLAVDADDWLDKRSSIVSHTPHGKHELCLRNTDAKDRYGQPSNETPAE